MTCLTPPFTSRSEVNYNAILPFALICGLAGAVPQLLFLHDFGPHTYFQSAPDESFYLLAIFGDIPAWNDYPLRSVLSFLVDVSGLTKPAFAIAADIVFPFIVGLAAGTVAMATTRTLPAIILSAFIITFGGDLFSFNSAIFSIDNLSISRWLQSYEITERRYFLDVFSSFLALYRTLEPQLSFSIFLFHIANLISFLRSTHRSRTRTVLTTVTALLCAGVYAFFSLAAAAIGCAAVLALLVAGESKRAAHLAAGVGAGFICTFWVLATGYLGEAASMLFESRLPLLSVSMIFGCIGATAIICQHGRAIRRKPLLLFSVALLLFPVAVLNQQIATGVMIQAANWERYVNMSCVIIGLLISFGGRRKEASTRRAGNHVDDNPDNRLRSFMTGSAASVLLLVSVAGVLFISLLDNYRKYVSFNLQSIAYAQAIDQAIDQHGSAIRKIVLDNMAIDAPVQARLEATGVEFFGYTALVAGLKASEGGDAASNDLAWSTTRAAMGFDIAARLGFSPKQYETALKNELASYSCWPHLMFLADFLECAPYVSDFRHYRPSLLEGRISEAVSDYAAYLASDTHAHDSAALVLSSKPIADDGSNRLWQIKPLGVTELSVHADAFGPSLSITIFAYVQSPS